MVVMAERGDQNAKNSQNEEKDLLGKVSGREWTKEPMGRCPDGQKAIGIEEKNEGPKKYRGKRNTQEGERKGNGEGILLIGR